MSIEANDDKKNSTFFDTYEKKCAERFQNMTGYPPFMMFDNEFVDARRYVRRCKSAEDLKKIRRLLRDYGIDKFKQELVEKGVLDEYFNISDEKNIFAKFISGKITPSYGDSKDDNEFFFAHNLKEYDDNVHNATTKWLGKSSFSETHKFIVPRDLTNWTYINGLTLGIESTEDAQRAIEMLEKMKEYAIKKVAKRVDEVTLAVENLGFYLHISPFNSIHLLHLHVVDLTKCGPTFTELSFKNLPLEDMLKVLKEEVERSGSTLCCPKFVVSPWLQSSWEPDKSIKSLI